MTGGFVPVKLGGGGNTEYSDPVSTDAVIRRLPTDKGYAVKALINRKWTSVNKDDIATVK